jgi:hypothetical protein
MRGNYAALNDDFGLEAGEMLRAWGGCGETKAVAFTTVLDQLRTAVDRA